jgi:MHS family proline/betaine transporter-like MFS transporter
LAIFKDLKRSQKEAIGLLQIGTFLEYFDLMLYVHMAVLLNELFFPKTDQHTAALLSAFAFCSTYVFRPIAALMFGYIGDNIGRKAAIIISTSMMAVSCFFMSIIPTYAEIGIFASIAMITCRILQSFSATGEVIGAEIYLSEILKPPGSYQLVSWVSELCTLGSLFALLAASLILKCNASWRAMFVFGGMIAVSGAIARRKLRETPDFLRAQANKHKIELRTAKVCRKTSLAYFSIYSGFPLCFYLIFIYSSDILKNSLSYTPVQVINHNLLLTILSFLIGISLIFLTKKVPPLKILKIRAILSSAVLFIMPLLPLTNIYALTSVQVLLTIFALGTLPAIPIFFKHFPVYRRFTYSSVLYAFSRAFMYVITSFGLVYLTKILGYYGLWLIMIPVSISFLWGVNHFEKLEKMETADTTTFKLTA